MHTTVKSESIHVLVVDDDPRTRKLLDEYLTSEGFRVVAVASGEGIADIVCSERIQIVLLDLMLGAEDGLSLCRRLRMGGIGVPIIMLTAKGSDMDRIIGLELGADDYMAKPFNPRELVARIRAVLRRHVEPSLPARYAFGPFELDLAARRLTRTGRPIELTGAEFDVLLVLVTHPDQPLSRERLVELSRRRSFVAHDRSMDVQISRLRRLIEDDASMPRYIRTVWGFGYVFVPLEGAR